MYEGNDNITDIIYLQYRCICIHEHEHFEYTYSLKGK